MWSSSWSGLLLALLHLLMLQPCALSWDFALTIDSHIEFYNNNGSRAGIASQQLNSLGPLAFDPVHKKMYFSEMTYENTTLFSFHLVGNKNIEHLVKRRFKDNIKGIDVDPVSKMLFWTDGRNQSIHWISLAPGAENSAASNILLRVDKQEPTGIAVDSCRSLIFWTNVNSKRPSIERATIKGLNRKVIIDSKIRNPISIVLDERLSKIYWIDKTDLNEFIIESANYDGSNRTIIYKGKNMDPYDLAIDDDYLLWTEWSQKSVWKLSLSSNDTRAENVLNVKSNNPMGIVTNVDLLNRIGNIMECAALKDTIHNETSNLSDQMNNCDNKMNVVSNIQMPIKHFPYCLNGGVLETDRKATDSKCNCLKGFTGLRCEIPMCHNYCLNGTCILNESGFPECRCDDGFSGKRCQQNMCNGYCLNNGTCLADKTQIYCQCLLEWSGTRCEVQKKTEVKIVHLENNHISKSTESNDSDTNESNREMNIISSEMLTSQCLEWEMTDPIILTLISLSVVLCLVIVALSIKIMSLMKRPRIKKRIIVNKNVTPLTYRPNPPQCEITIENCCNMNICETPCFEPEGMRTVVEVNKKDEKKNLLLNMESCDSLY